MQKTLLKERGKLLASTRMDQVTDDSRRLGKISQLGHEKIGFDATTTSTGREHVYSTYVVVMCFLCSIFNVHTCVDTTKSNVVSDTVSSDEPTSADLSGI